MARVGDSGAITQSGGKIQLALPLHCTRFASVIENSSICRATGVPLIGYQSSASIYLSHRNYCSNVSRAIAHGYI